MSDEFNTQNDFCRVRVGPHFHQNLLISTCQHIRGADRGNPAKLRCWICSIFKLLTWWSYEVFTWYVRIQENPTKPFAIGPKVEVEKIHRESRRGKLYVVHEKAMGVGCQKLRPTSRVELMLPYPTFIFKMQPNKGINRSHPYICLSRAQPSWLMTTCKSLHRYVSRVHVAQRWSEGDFDR